MSSVSWLILVSDFLRRSSDSYTKPRRSRLRLWLLSVHMIDHLVCSCTTSSAVSTVPPRATLNLRVNPLLSCDDDEFSGESNLA